jgi:integrase
MQLETFQFREGTRVKYTVEWPSAAKIAGQQFGKPEENEGKRLWDLYEKHNAVLWDASTFHAYCVRSFVRQCDAILVGTSVADFSQSSLDKLISALRYRGNSNATINRKLSAVSKLLKKGFAMGEIRSLPEFRRLKERTGRIRFLEVHEEKALFSAIARQSDWYFQLSVFLVDTGARLGEAIGLRWNDLNGGRATFWLTKSGKSRTIPLTSRACNVVEENSMRDQGPFIGIKQYQFRAVWNEAKKSVGLGNDPDVVPHILRHTCASRLVRGGVDMRRVQTWLGHQSLQMTMRYAHCQRRCKTRPLGGAKVGHLAPQAGNVGRA